MTVGTAVDGDDIEEHCKECKQSYSEQETHHHTDQLPRLVTPVEGDERDEREGEEEADGQPEYVRVVIHVRQQAEDEEDQQKQQLFEERPPRVLHQGEVLDEFREEAADDAELRARWAGLWGKK